MRNPWIRATLSFVWGLGLFFAIAYGLKYVYPAHSTGAPSEPNADPLARLEWNDPAIISQVLLKATMIVAAFLIWTILGRPLREMGWRRPDWRNRAHLVWFAVAIVTVMAASVAMVLLDVQHPLAARLKFVQLIVVVWLLSSFSEEIYVRGLVQSWAAEHDNPSRNSILTPAIGASALLFAAMHLTLIWSPAGLKGGLTLSTAMLFVGWACAALRARSRSLWSPIAAHVFGNIAGLPGGILGIVFYRLFFGDFPDFVKAAMHR